MKSKILFIFFLFLYYSNVFAESIFIESKNISIDKIKETSIFENEVNVKTKDGSSLLAILQNIIKLQEF